MAAAYSMRFMLGTLPGGGGSVDSDPVPTGYIWVLNWVTAVMEGNPNGYFFVKGPGGINIGYWNMYQIFANLNVKFHVVFNAGEQITVQALDTASPCDYTVSGYQLSTT